MSETEVGTEPTPPADTPIAAEPAAEAAPAPSVEAEPVLDGSAPTAAGSDGEPAPAPTSAGSDGEPAPVPTAAAPDGEPQLDLDAIARELADVEHALRRLDDGTYWTDEITGAPIPDEILAADPTARRAVR